MSGGTAVQMVGPFFNHDNFNVVKILNAAAAEVVPIDKDQGIVLVDPSSTGNVDLLLPPNPEAGESHRIVNASTRNNVNVDGGSNPTTVFNFTGTGIQFQVLPGSIVDVTWTELPNGWVPTCCAGEIG